jgi:hypothetical protein
MFIKYDTTDVEKMKTIIQSMLNLSLKIISIKNPIILYIIIRIANNNNISNHNHSNKDIP